MTGDRLAYLSLRFDAVYCLVLGSVVAGTAALTAPSVELPAPLLIGVGSAVFVWGAYVWRAASQKPVRTSARVVMIANIAASLALAATGIVAGTTVLTIAAVALAIDVAAFAVSQGAALQRLRAEASV